MRLLLVLCDPAKSSSTCLPARLLALHLKHRCVQVLLSLTVGETMVRREDGIWQMSCSQTKTGAHLLDYEVCLALRHWQQSLQTYSCLQLPANVSRWCDVWMQNFRPLFVESAPDATTAFFVTFGGKQRKNMSALCRTTVEKMIGVTVNPHAFRTIVASALYEPGRVANTLLLVL